MGEELKIRILRNNKLKKVKISKIIIENNKLIFRLGSKWVRSFYFDKSIDADDLSQELRIKLMSSLKYYNYKHSGIKTYITNIAKNLFINKKISLLSMKNYPHDFNGETIEIYSTETEINDNGLTLLDILKSNNYDPEKNMIYKQIIEILKIRLNKVKFKPKNFKKRLRSFARIVFDTLYNSNEKFNKFMLFNYRCRIRYSTKHRLRIPDKSIIVSKSLAEYFKVEISSINIILRIIKKEMKNCFKEINKKEEQ